MLDVPCSALWVVYFAVEVLLGHLSVVRLGLQPLSIAIDLLFSLIRLEVISKLEICGVI
jgi:hypothetical protein